MSLLSCIFQMCVSLTGCHGERGYRDGHERALQCWTEGIERHNIKADLTFSQNLASVFEGFEGLESQN